MNNDLVKDFTQWMNEGFAGTLLENNPKLSFQLTKPLLLADGTAMSIQAGRSHYCSPRENSPSGDYDFYDTFEIGFPNVIIMELLEYAEDESAPKDTVYAGVPKELIRDIIANRGGVVGYDEEK